MPHKRNAIEQVDHKCKPQCWCGGQRDPVRRAFLIQSKVRELAAGLTLLEMAALVEVLRRHEESAAARGRTLQLFAASEHWKARRKLETHRPVVRARLTQAYVLGLTSLAFDGLHDIPQATQRA